MATKVMSYKTPTADTIRYLIGTAKRTGYENIDFDGWFPVKGGNLNEIKSCDNVTMFDCHTDCVDDDLDYKIAQRNFETGQTIYNYNELYYDAFQGYNIDGHLVYYGHAVDPHPVGRQYANRKLHDKK